jgi:hypothetical protein
MFRMVFDAHIVGSEGKRGKLIRAGEMMKGRILGNVTRAAR